MSSKNLLLYSILLSSTGYIAGMESNIIYLRGHHEDVNNNNAQENKHTISSEKTLVKESVAVTLKNLQINIDGLSRSIVKGDLEAQDFFLISLKDQLQHLKPVRSLVQFIGTYNANPEFSKLVFLIAKSCILANRDDLLKTVIVKNYEQAFLAQCVSNVHDMAEYLNKFAKNIYATVDCLTKPVLNLRDSSIENRLTKSIVRLDLNRIFEDFSNVNSELHLTVLNKVQWLKTLVPFICKNNASKIYTSINEASDKFSASSEILKRCHINYSITQHLDTYNKHICELLKQVNSN